jgi:hypothetical protein
MSNTVPIDESILDFFSLSDNDKVIVVRIGLQCINKSKECSSEEWKIKMDEIENSYISKLNNSEQELKNQIEMFKQYKQSSQSMTNELIQDVRNSEHIKYESDINALKSSIQERELVITKLNSDMIQFTKDVDSRYDKRMTDMSQRYENKISELEFKIEESKRLQMDEIGRTNNSTIKGRDGELFVYSKLQKLFPKSEIEYTHNMPRRGDFIILNDVSNKDIQCAVFVSLTSGICNKDDFSFEIYNNIPILFIHNLQEHMESLLIVSGFFKMVTNNNDIDLTNKEIVDYYKQISVTLKRNFTKQKSRIEKFCREQIESISEQELSIIGLYKKTNMKY